MSPNSDSRILRSSLVAYLEELAESGIEGFSAEDANNIRPAESGPVTPVGASGIQASLSPVTAAVEQHETLEKIRKSLGDCQRCKLGNNRKNLVFGAGNTQARLVFIGEGPDADEDLKGEPFSGEAGLVFNRIISAMGLKREEVYLCNLVKCRPPKEHDPDSAAIEACAPFLLRQIRSIGPEVIVSMGTFASQVLLDTKDPLAKLRGRFRDFHGIPLMPTLHPSYLLSKKGDAGPFWDVWDDMTQVLRLLKLPVPDKSRKTG